MPGPNPQNLLTFDVEEWYHANYDGLDHSPEPGQPTRLDYLVHRLLDLCAHHNVKSTFFVLGSVAEAKPAIVREINNRPVSRHFQTGLQNAPAAFFGIVNVREPPRSSAWSAS